jgi:hypothetical protein
MDLVLEFRNGRMTGEGAKGIGFFVISGSYSEETIRCNSLDKDGTDLSEVVTGQVKEYRGGKAQGVDPVHDSAVSLDQVAIIFNSTIAFDGRHDQPAGKPHQSDGEGHSGRLPRRKGCGPSEPHPD